jgi:hypothetical protein
VNVEELLRNSLHSEAGNAAPIADLLDTSIEQGRRKQRVRRTATVFGTVAAMGIVGAGAVVVGNVGPSSTQTVTPSSGSDPTASEPVTPWWQTWSTDRHNGPVDATFLANARPTYDDETSPEDINVWASGTAPDGTDWVMFTSHSTGHEIEWLQGWDGSPDYGESTQTTTPGITWTSFSTPTRAAHDSGVGVQQWLIIVGRPGTTGIDYSPDGQTWRPLDVRDGIAVYKVPSGFPPAAAQVRLSDGSSVYATGAPDGAGVGDNSDASPTATADPTATPADGAAAPDANEPSNAPGVVVASPTPTN